MSVEAVIVGEIISGILMLLREKAIAAGVKAEEVDRMIAEAAIKARQSRPEDLPDGR